MRSILIAMTFLPFTAAAESPDLNRALQSEYTYLVSQKESLLRQSRSMEQNFARRSGQAKKRVMELQRELVSLTAKNDEQHEDLGRLEKIKKELARRGTSLEATYKKATKQLFETERALRFDVNKSKVDMQHPLPLTLNHLGPIFSKADELLRASTRSEVFEGYFLDEKDRLQQGQVTRIGRVAAFLKNQDQQVLLGPSGQGPLKALTTFDQGSYFVFDNLNEPAILQRPGTWVEILADFSPVMFLGMILMLVAGLFTVLVKI